jgi:dTDP-4-amino-4,6-dideoxygalactose transaminase
MKVPMTIPYFDEKEYQAVKQVLESGWLIQGSKVEELERQYCEYTGAKYAVACGNCTEALHMALLALGIGKGDSVLVPAYTFVATANAVEYTGATPVFVDIDLKTFNMDIAQVADCVSCYGCRRHIEALMPVHLFGLCVDMRYMILIATEYGLPIVEDAACALGSECPKGKAGNMGIGCFSMHPRKSVTTGEGGMLTTNDERIYNQAHALRDFGFTVTNLERHKLGATIMPEVNMLGYNYRMTDIVASIGVEQMKKFDWILSEKIRRAHIYDEALSRLGWLQIPYVPKGYVHTYQSYAVLLGDKYEGLTVEYIEKWGVVRDRIMNELKEKSVATRQGTHAVHMLGYYAKKYNIKPSDYMNTYAADKIALTIPLYPQMGDDTQQYVIDCIKAFKV